jgi:oligoendopeptidase F
MTDAASDDELTPELGPLPGWNLGDLYAGREDPELLADLDDAAARARAFSADHAGKLADLDGAAMAAAVTAFEEIQETLGRIGSFAFLTYAIEMSDPAVGQFFQNMQENLNAVTTDLLFFTLELNRIDDDVLQAKFDEAPAFARYRPWVRDVRAFRDHQLDDDLEKILHEKEVAGRGAWLRLFDETMSNLRFPMRNRQTSEDEDKTSEEVLHLLSGKDADLRREAALSLGKVFNENVRLFALITNTLAKDKDIEDRWRSFADPADSRHLANQVEGEVVAALADAVKTAYPAMSHRYYAMKARWMGKESLDYWDRNAPLPEDANRLVSWPLCRFFARVGRSGAAFFRQRLDRRAGPGGQDVGRLRSSHGARRASLFDAELSGKIT